MAEIRLQAVKKKYGNLQVIHGVDVDIADGEFIVIVGPSGCGKSTLLRMIAGLEQITDGDISIAGKRVNEVEPKDRNIAMVFQNYALYPHMTVYDNPASLFVAGFIGSPAMNFLPGQRVGDAVEIGEGVRIALPPAVREKAGQGVTVGVRPEHFVSSDAGEHRFTLKVDTVEALGADSLLHCAFGPSSIVVRVDGHSTPEPGTPLAVAAMTGKTFFFDTASGKRL